MERMKIGVIGCGMISGIYLQNLTTTFSKAVEVVACADRNVQKAEQTGEKYGIQGVDIDTLLADPEIELVVNLTIPSVHAEIGKRALLAGKHHYSEKPLATNWQDAVGLTKLAKEKGLYAVCAPDTFLGGGLQTCRKLLEDGTIGRPVYAQGLMLSAGPETFHPNPRFLYERGAGPLMDMGPYYYAALMSLFGPVTDVTGFGVRNGQTRQAQNPESPYYGQDFPCDVNTLVSGSLKFQSGVLANVVTAWDMSNPYWLSGLPLLQVFGTEGAMILPDPNTFGGVGGTPMDTPQNYVLVRKGSGNYEKVEIPYGFTENSRGLGVADFAWCLRHGIEPKINMERSLHIMEILSGVLEAGQCGSGYRMTTTCTIPEPMREPEF